MRKLIDILIILLTAMMIVAAACMIFSCRSHRDVMQEKEAIVKTEISEESSIAEAIKQHAHEQEQKKMSFEWVLNYSMLSEPDSAGRQHPTQTGTLTGKAKGESASSKDSSEEHERDIKESATKKEDRQQHESYAERVRVEKASATPISLITLAMGLIITAVCVKWIVFKKGSKPWKR